MPNKVKKRHLLDYSIFIPYLILSIVGLIMVYSSTSALQVMKGFSPTSFVINQVAFWVVGLVAMFFIYKMKTSVYHVCHCGNYGYGFSRSDSWYRERN